MHCISTLALKANLGFKTCVFILFLLSDRFVFAQSGTTVFYEDNYGPLTLTYTGLIDGKHSYAWIDPMSGINSVYLRYSSANSRWQISYSSNLILGYYSNQMTASNPPNFTVGQWIDADLGDGTVMTALSGSGTTGVLPIELISFEAQSTEAGTNKLTWKTTSEIQNKGFEIERSTDGTRFEKIGFVKGNGTINETKKYEFIDEKPTANLMYYRLKQIDTDGGFEYSKVVSVLRKSDQFNVTNISPNPTNGVLNIVVETKTEDDLSINLLDILGKTIKQQKATTQQGLNNQSLDLQDLPNGLYFLQIQQGTERVIKKVVKE